MRSHIWWRILFEMLSVAIILLDVAFRIALSISDGVISGHSYDVRYSNPSMSASSTLSGGEKKHWRKVSSLARAWRASPHSGFLSAGPFLLRAARYAS